ncbi:hypothetical protein F5144DRAFT_644837, partial [Chaetomium tenue]
MQRFPLFSFVSTVCCCPVTRSRIDSKPGLLVTVQSERATTLRQLSWVAQTRHSSSADTRGDARLRHSPARRHAGRPTLLITGTESLLASNPYIRSLILPSPPAASPNSTSLTSGGGANLTRRDTSDTLLPNICSPHATRSPALPTISAT